MSQHTLNSIIENPCVQAAIEADPTVAQVVNRARNQVGSEPGSRRSTLEERMYERYVNFMLSSPGTHAVNSTSTALSLLMRPFETLSEATLSRVRFWAPQDKIYYRDALAEAGGMAAGAQDAMRYLAKRLTSFDSTHDIVRNMGYPQELAAASWAKSTHGALTAAARGRSGLLGQMTDVWASAINLPGNAVGAADVFFKIINFRAQVARDAMHSGLSMGLTNADGALSSHINSYVQEAFSGANTEGLARGIRDANYRTFNDVPTKDVFGKLTQEMVYRGNDFGLVRWLVPFKRAVVNSTLYGFERSPFGAFMAMFEKDPVQRMAMLSRASTGTLMLGGMYMAFGDNLVGGPPKGENNIALWNKAGYEAYSFHTPVGNIPFKYFGPLGLAFAAMADYKQAVSNIDFENDPSAEHIIGQHAGALLQASVKALATNHWIKPAATAFSAFMDGAQNGNWNGLVRLASHMASAATVPAVIRDYVTRDIDPNKHDVTDPWDYYRAQVPILSKDVPVKIDFLTGEPITYDNFNTPELASPLQEGTGDRVINEMIRLKVKVPETKRMAQVGDGIPSVPMTPQEYQQMKIWAGKGDPEHGIPPMKEAIRAFIDSPAFDRFENDAPKAKIISDIISTYNKFGRNKIQSDPNFDFGERLKAAQQQRTEQMK